MSVCECCGQIQPDELDAAHKFWQWLGAVVLALIIADRVTNGPL